LLDDEGYWELPASTRGIYHAILLISLKNPGRIPADTLTLTRKSGLKISRRSLERLEQAGLLVICASIEQASRWHAAGPRDARNRDRVRELRSAVGEGPIDRARLRSEQQTDQNGKSAKGKDLDLDDVLPLPAERLGQLDRLASEIGRDV